MLVSQRRFSIAKAKAFAKQATGGCAASTECLECFPKVSESGCIIVSTHPGSITIVRRTNAKQAAGVFKRKRREPGVPFRNAGGWMHPCVQNRKSGLNGSLKTEYRWRNPCRRMRAFACRATASLRLPWSSERIGASQFRYHLGLHFRMKEQKAGFKASPTIARGNRLPPSPGH